MKGQFQGKVALVTGGGLGIGRATALALAGEEAKVVVDDLSVKEGEETVRMIKEAGGEAIFIQADVTQRSEVEKLILNTVEEYGRIDYAFNNVGIGGDYSLTADCTEENWDRTMNTNLKSVFLCMKYEIPRMLKQGGGVIINTASNAGFHGVPNMVAYATSKHGILGLTKTAALEYATAGIRVNAICPGPTFTSWAQTKLAGHPELEAKWAEAIPMKRWGRPEEIAEAVVWLCSDRALYVTGIAMPLDGGMAAN